MSDTIIDNAAQRRYELEIDGQIVFAIYDATATSSISVTSKRRYRCAAPAPPTG